jgi:hypothetical protein
MTEELIASAWLGTLATVAVLTGCASAASPPPKTEVVHEAAPPWIRHETGFIGPLESGCFFAVGKVEGTIRNEKLRRSTALIRARTRLHDTIMLFVRSAVPHHTCDGYAVPTDEDIEQCARMWKTLETLLRAMEAAAPETATFYENTDDGGTYVFISLPLEPALRSVRGMGDRERVWLEKRLFERLQTTEGVSFACSPAVLQ